LDIASIKNIGTHSFLRFRDNHRNGKCPRAWYRYSVSIFGIDIRGGIGSFCFSSRLRLEQVGDALLFADEVAADLDLGVNVVKSMD
jgi:hypothetical protein